MISHVRLWILLIVLWFLFQVILNSLLPVTNDGRRDTSQQPNTEKTKLQKNRENSHFQIVFSTDCSGYQHWQGILLYYSALRVNQTGTITRIASGCSREEQEKIKAEWKNIDPSQTKFRVHFAPSSQLNGNKYKYSNKPGGILHWLREDASILPRDAVVCLLDPDMVLLKPLTPFLVPSSSSKWTKRKRNKNQIEYVDETGIARILRVDKLPHDQQLPERISIGHGAGQHFGVGAAWVQGQQQSTARPVWQNFSKEYVCGTGSPCVSATHRDVFDNYAVGPVYIATVHDWNLIASTWMDFVHRVYEQYPHLLAEMYAFTMAVTHLQIPFTLQSNYMVTGADVGSPTEGWSWVDDVIQHHPIDACSGADSNRVPHFLVDPRSTPLPNVLHYCQPYKLVVGLSNDSEYLFSKRKIEHDFFSCTNKGHPFHAKDILTFLKAETTKSFKAIRASFALCYLIPLLNSALYQYQRDVCRMHGTQK